MEDHNEDPYEALREEVSKKSSKKSENFDKLSSTQQKHVLGFVAWLTSKGWGKDVVSSYKSYVVCTLAGLPLTNDRKSGMKKFFEYLDETDEG